MTTYASSVSGSSIVKVLPVPRVVWQSIFPPCSLMICNVWASPSPVPSRLVVKNGTNRLRASSSVMPWPLSPMQIRIFEPLRFALTVKFPPSGIASSALRLWHSRELEVLLQHLANSQYLRTHFAQKRLALLRQARIGIYQAVKLLPDQIQIQ